MSTLAFISIPTQEVLCFGLWIRIFSSRVLLHVKPVESETGLTNARNSIKDSETKLIPSLCSQLLQFAIKTVIFAQDLNLKIVSGAYTAMFLKISPVKDVMTYQMASASNVSFRKHLH